jgi:hypothetical protein
LERASDYVEYKEEAEFEVDYSVVYILILLPFSLSTTLLSLQLFYLKLHLTQFRENKFTVRVDWYNGISVGKVITSNARTLVHLGCLSLAYLLAERGEKGQALAGRIRCSASLWLI